MAKTKTSFFCNECGAQSARWQGQCTSCKSWNTINEEIITTTSTSVSKKINPDNISSKPTLIRDIEVSEEIRLKTGDNELNRVLGGGIVPGSLTLLGGEPGIGKSTLLLQISMNLNYKTLYVSGEESQKQIKLRANRLKHNNNNCIILTETNTDSIFHHIKNIQPEILIIDSIQTIHTNSIDSSPGTVSQIRECTSELLKIAKENNISILLIGHITKDGSIAGPKILEHMVDTVLQFEGDRNHIFRILRAHKNRFGSTSEIGIYEMFESGLKEVQNPSEILLTNSKDILSGTVVACSIEGNRPMMIEIQALVSTAVYGTPQRSTTGYNAKRLNMLLAVLEKRIGFKLATKDVFLNVTGGINIEDTAIDLAVITAILSSNEDITISNKICFAGEIGLSGEIRPVSKIEQRIKEAEKLGFEKIFISQQNKLIENHKGIEIYYSSKVEDVYNQLFT
ncbi:MAG: DNA repair protein RadA [Flavobacteriales bacterium]|nr:DNA repair protein RadA [Flavobacteriales bacterium]